MSKVKPVHRYKAQTLFSFGGAKIEYFPRGPDVVMASEYDAQRLRADTAEAELISANADKEAYAQNAIDLRTSLDAVTLNLKRADELIGTRTADLLECGTRRKTVEAELKTVRESHESMRADLISTDAKLAAAEQRIAHISVILSRIIEVQKTDYSIRGGLPHRWECLIAEADAALNQKSEGESHES